MPFVPVLRVVLRLHDQAGERLQPVLGRELVEVDAGRDLVHPVDVTDDVLEHGADVRGADEDRVGAAREPRLPTARAPGRPRIEYSSSDPCAFTA